MLARLFVAGAVTFGIGIFEANADASCGRRTLTKEVVVATDARTAWALWTTNEGAQSFFPGARNGTNIQLRPGGPYEFFFLPNNERGMRGCDGCVILGYQEGVMLSFTWTNRPEMVVRPHRTHVVLHFDELGPKRTRVTFVQDGWGTGADWDIAYSYFDHGWTRVLEAYKAYVDGTTHQRG